ncbi:MAG: hypothetical protein AAFO73_02015 [Pseudomonadota bacterium]
MSSPSTILVLRLRAGGALFTPLPAVARVEALEDADAADTLVDASFDFAEDTLDAGF